MRPIIISLCAPLLAIAAAPAVAAQEAVSRLYCTRALGAYFYCAPATKPHAEPAPPADDPSTDAGLSARERAARIREEVEEARAAAVLDPSADNVAHYIRVQRAQLDRASRFADVWRRVLWAEPELDYTLVRPVGQLAKKVWLDERAQTRDAAVKATAGRYGLFYFFSSTCAACEAFSPVLKAFADAHGLTVRAVSVDGGPSLYFPDAVADAGQRAAMGLGDAPTPAVALFDAETKDVTPVAFGIVSAADLADRIFLLTTTEAGDEL